MTETSFLGRFLPASEKSNSLEHKFAKEQGRSLKGFLATRKKAERTGAWVDAETCEKQILPENGRKKSKNGTSRSLQNDNQKAKSTQPQIPPLR